MTYRTTITALGAALLCAGLVAGATAKPAAAQELKLATFMGPSHHLNTVAFPKYIDAVKKATGGEVDIKLFSGGQLGKGPLQQYKRVIDKVAEVSFGVVGYTASIFPRTMVVSQPGVGQTAEEFTKKVWKVYPEFLTEEYSRMKVLGLWANVPGVIISRDKKVETIADVKGMKLRALDSQNIDMMNEWGASGIFIPISSVYDALDKGVIDGVFVAPNGVYNPWRFGEVAKHVTVGMDAPTALFWFGMHQETWDGLSANAKAGIDKVSGLEFSVETAHSWADPDRTTIKKLKAGDPKTSYHELSPAAAAEFNKRTQAYLEKYLTDLEEKGIPARAIYKMAASPLS